MVPSIVDLWFIGIAPTRNSSHFLKIGFVVAGAGFIPSKLEINQIGKYKIRKKLSFMHIKIFNTFLKLWLQFHVGAISRRPLFIWS